MNIEIEFIPLAPVGLIAALALVALAFTAFALWRSMRAALLRLAAMTAFLAALANPLLNQRQSEPLDDTVLVITDQSPSQSLENRNAQTKAALNALEKELGNTSRLKIKSAATSTGANNGTRLFSALMRAQGNIPPERIAAAILITDGQVHDIPAKAAILGFDAPLHVLITGKKDGFDRRVIIERAPRFGIVGKSMTIAFRIHETKNRRKSAASSASVSIWINGEKFTEKNLAINATHSLPVKIERRGENTIEIIAETAPGELTNVNNRAVITTTGVRDRLRVLLVSGEPHAGERTWRQLLKSDAMVDLVHFTILRPPSKQDGTPTNELSLITFPTRELFVEKLKQFDLIIFDRYKRRAVLPLIYMENVADYVRGGGAILAAAGPDFASPFSLYRTPLADILPGVPTGEVTQKPFRPAITGLGRRHPVTKNLPGGGKKPEWGRWFRLVDAEVDDGDVLMSGADGKPLLVLSRQNQGRVALLLSDHAWLWTRGYEGGGPQAELLRRLAHWLMKEPDLEEEALEAEALGGKLTIKRRSLKEKVPPAIITLPSGKTQNIKLELSAPGLWTKTIDLAKTGFYRISNGKLKAVAASGPVNPLEFKDVVATTSRLAPLVKQTGGGVFWLGENSQLPSLRNTRPGRAMSGASWMGLRRSGAEKLIGEKRIPLMNGLLGIAILLGLAAITWKRESS